MKKIGAILLLAVMLFNLGGYRWLFNLLEQNSTAKLESKISHGNYKNESLTEIRIPLNMPYYSDKDYESVYGEITWEGKYYRYVKRKISGNVLHLLCLPNDDKDKLVSAKNDFARAQSDQRQNTPDSKGTPFVIKLMMSKYISDPGFCMNLQSSRSVFTDHNESLISQFDPLTAGQPPELA